jgi:hypothetical protein
VPFLIPLFHPDGKMRLSFMTTRFSQLDHQHGQKPTPAPDLASTDNRRISNRFDI